MSAFIVDRCHIDALLTAGLTHTPSYPGDAMTPVSWFDAPLTEYDGSEWYATHHKSLTRETADETGRMLWWECMRSVAYRYPDDAIGALPGPVGLTLDEIYGYTFTCLPGDPDPVVVLSLIACYEYQTCEHPDWHTSEAREFCEALRDRTIRRLPGYDDAPWTADGRDVFLRVATGAAGRRTT
mgnify:FL=1